MLIEWETNEGMNERIKDLTLGLLWICKITYIKHLTHCLTDILNTENRMVVAKERGGESQSEQIFSYKKKFWRSNSQHGGDYS